MFNILTDLPKCTILYASLAQVLGQFHQKMELHCRNIVLHHWKLRVVREISCAIYQRVQTYNISIQSSYWFLCHSSCYANLCHQKNNTCSWLFTGVAISGAGLIGRLACLCHGYSCGRGSCLAYFRWCMEKKWIYVLLGKNRHVFFSGGRTKKRPKVV